MPSPFQSATHQEGLRAEYDSEALAHQLQRTIEQIKDVTSARVILDEEGAISEIHLVGSSGRKAKQIVRDIESCCTRLVST